MTFDPYNCPLKIQKSIGTLKSQSGSSFGSVGVHSLTLSYTPMSMKCDSRASLLARTFANPYFGCEPKATVATLQQEYVELNEFNWKTHYDFIHLQFDLEWMTRDYAKMEESTLEQQGIIIDLEQTYQDLKE